MRVMKRIPPIQCLVTFEVLSRVRSIKLAAEELCVTPSAISHRIRLLESILKIQMFNENFTLSEQGERYIKIVCQVLDLLKNIQADVKEFESWELLS